MEGLPFPRRGGRQLDLEPHNEAHGSWSPARPPTRAVCVCPAGSCSAFVSPCTVPARSTRSPVAQLVEGVIIWRRSAPPGSQSCHIQTHEVPKSPSRQGALASDSAPGAPWSCWQQGRHHLLAKQPSGPVQGHCQLHTLATFAPAPLGACWLWALGLK